MAKRKKHKPSSLHMAVLAGIASINANAVGMGEIAVRSRLNEPLRADVPLLELEPNLADRAMVRFHATGDDAAGSTNSSVVSKLTGKLVRGKDGMVLEIRSRGTIREPVVSFHVELILPNAHTRREYTVLLDPPAAALESVTESAAAPTQSNPYDFEAMERNIGALAAAPGSKRNKKARAPDITSVTTESASTPATPVSQQSITEKPSRPIVERKKSTVPAKPVHTSASTPTFSGDVYGPVVKNETLWGIARKVRPNRDIGMFDVMQLLLAENPHAFVKNDMNRLRTGVTLKIPDFTGSGKVETVADATANTDSASSANANDATATADATPASSAAATISTDAPASTTAPAAAEPAVASTTVAATPSGTPAVPTTDTAPDTGVASATVDAAATTAVDGTSTVEPAAEATAVNGTQEAPATSTATGTALEQAAAMQAQLNSLAKRLETMQSALSERESKIANLEQSLTDLNGRLQEAQARNAAGTAAIASSAPAQAAGPTAAQAETPTPTSEAPTATADVPATTAEAQAPVAETDAQGSADTAAASFEGVRLPPDTWVWGMSAAVVAGLGAAFLARRRRVGAKNPKSTSPTAMPPVAASAPSAVAVGVNASAQQQDDERRVAELLREQENYQRTVRLERPVGSGAVTAPDSEFAIDTGNAFDATAIDIAPTQPALGDTNTVAWEDNNTVPNWSLERTIERTLEETGETLAQTRTEPFLASSPAAQPPASNKVVPIKLDAAFVEPVLKEVDLQMAYLQFEDAERLLMQPLQEHPNEPSLLVKLAEVHVAAGSIDRFVDLAVRLSKIPEVREGSDWKKIARMGEMVAPNHPLFEFVDTVELTQDGFGSVASHG